MNEQQALKLLVHAAQLDPTILPADKGDRLTKASVWADQLELVSFQEAMDAVRAHYRTSAVSVTVTELLAAHRAGVEREPGLNPWRDAPCNPQILRPQPATDGRFAVVCVPCGYLADQYCDTFDVAVGLRDTHQRRAR